MEIVGRLAGLVRRGWVEMVLINRVFEDPEFQYQPHLVLLTTVALQNKTRSTI